MRRIAVLLVFVSAGCSTAPLADFLDWVHPAKIHPEADYDTVDPLGSGGKPAPGGVLLQPQGPAQILAPAAPPGSFQPTPDTGGSPGPLRVPNT
jgi:hypothetical protein